MTVAEIQPNLNGDCATLIYRAKEAIVREQLHEIRKPLERHETAFDQWELFYLAVRRRINECLDMQNPAHGRAETEVYSVR